MNIIFGASGQVGSEIADYLTSHSQSVKAIIRNPDKRKKFNEDKNLSVEIADAFDLPALKKAFKNGDSVFLLTPETGSSEDIITDTGKILANFRNAIEGSEIKKIVGLSSIGAQYKENSGNLKMSYLLEHSFDDLNIQKVFIRPSFYYSNWLNYTSLIQETGVLPTFYPADLKFTMCSPIDIARFAGEVLMADIEGAPIYEAEGPEWYSPRDIAKVFGAVLNRDVMVQQIPPQDWWKTIKEFGFTDDATRNFIEMTKLVADGKTIPEGNGTVAVKVKTTFEEYLRAQLVLQ